MEDLLSTGPTPSSFHIMSFPTLIDSRKMIIHLVHAMFTMTPDPTMPTDSCLYTVERSPAGLYGRVRRSGMAVGTALHQGSKTYWAGWYYTVS